MTIQDLKATLRELKNQKAVYGRMADPSININIEKIERKVMEIEEYVEHHLILLNTHRRKLNILVSQAKILGKHGNVAHILLEIENVRETISSIKDSIRLRGVSVDDQAIDIQEQTNEVVIVQLPKDVYNAARVALKDYGINLEDYKS